MDEKVLREKLRKIMALFDGAGTQGEREAAGAAAGRIRNRLRKDEQPQREVEMRFTLPDPWARQLFTALCRRYDLRPYRLYRMHRQTILVRCRESFVDRVLWPEFEQLEGALTSYLSEITEKVIREEVHRETGDAEEVPRGQQIA